MSLADGEQRNLYIPVFRQNWSISISILQTEEQTYAYHGTDISTSDFVVFLTELGKHCIEISEEDFQGSYDISECPETQKVESS